MMMKRIQWKKILGLASDDVLLLDPHPNVTTPLG
jgi:hypothetical protein